MSGPLPASGHTTGRSPGEALRALRRTDSQVKRGRVMAVLEELKASGEPITFRGVARAAGVSHTLVYTEGVREHVERAIAGQAKAARRTAVAGGSASAASLACDLELARAQIKELRAERDTLKAAVQRGLGAALETAGTRELRRERESLAAQARAARDGSEADASMDVFNAMAEIRMAASRALSLLHKQQIRFTPDRAEAIAELCDGAEAAISAVRDLATGSALDDAALAKFLDENGKLL
ncbi:DUF6262 family protein [Nonomuraea turcica]|uniref:DUF6262 family protein n=1 Tax=Nonomuraea sp. G32 TaxID=3067274 RepID=UPI00273CA5A4|nr:DUF6262 family protein [Nonomuraea sp. G32]MDP4505307.1 DUF6262 family protein [Nonomuraea sp. G32]